MNQHSGGTDLQQLLSGMSPRLQDGRYVFLSFPGAGYGDHNDLEPIASFKEEEGLTLVVPEELAEKYQHSFDGVFRCITLQVHSSLEAVGLTAAFSKQLTASGISANVIAGFYHDHIFVSDHDSANAVESLLALTRSG